MNTPTRLSKLIAICTLAAWPLCSHAASIEIPVGTLQPQIEKAFPKTKNSLNLSEPLLALEASPAVAVLCGRWEYAPKVLASSAERALGGKFCAESRLQWVAQAGEVALSSVRVRSLTFGEGQSLPPTALALVNSILPGQLEGLVVYTAPRFVGWAIKNLRPLDGRLQIEF